MPTTQTAAGPSRPWLWVPSLYFAEGIPYTVVILISVVMYKRMGVSNTDIAAYTSLLYLPWLIKPLWSPLVGRLSTRRRWVLAMQVALAAGLAGTAAAISADHFLLATALLLAVTAVCSATHDVAADGFYMLALDAHQQAWFIGVRSTFYRLAFIAGQGGLVTLAGLLEAGSGPPPLEVTVAATATPPRPAAFDPRGFAPAPPAANQVIAAQQSQIELSVLGNTPAHVAALREEVRQWNVKHEFYAPPESAQPTDARETQRLAQLEAILRRWFGPSQAEVAQETRVGDAAIVLLRVTEALAPGEQLVVQFGRKTGDASFQVIEGERFTVTDQNWDQPLAALVQVEAKVAGPSEAAFEVRAGDVPLAWATTFYAIAGFFFLLAIYHLAAMPRPPGDVPQPLTGSHGLAESLKPFVSFFQKRQIVAMVSFLLLYRFAEAQLSKMAAPFLLDSREAGGLALTTGEFGVVYGTVGIAMLTVGGLLGGFVAARKGLKHWLWWMALAINLPNAAYLALAYSRPESLAAITSAVAVEQFGYGFGFTAYMVYCLYIARGNDETVHFALCTALMAAGMMIPGMTSGWLQEILGYQHFFIWVMLSTIPSFLVTALIPLDPEFGKKTD